VDLVPCHSVWAEVVRSGGIWAGVVLALAVLALARWLEACEAMKPIRTDATTALLGAPRGWDEPRHGECQVLPVVEADGVFYSYWRPTWRERLRVLFGRPVRLCVVANGMPPVAVDTDT
jgi:hypothetical protein